ncbi:MAG: Lactate 2-monooxygenase, partial [uncultured Sphingomonadaceae bacterium]
GHRSPPAAVRRPRPAPARRALLGRADGGAAGRARAPARAEGGGGARDGAARLRLSPLGRDAPHGGRQPGGAGRPAHRAADAPQRRGARHLHHPVRPHPARPRPPRPHRRAGAGAPGGRPRHGASGGLARRAHDLLQPGERADGGVRHGDGRRPALVPALLGQERRLRALARGAGGGLRLRGDCRYPRHHHARLAAGGPRSPVPALHARPRARAVHERPGLPEPAATPAGGGRPGGRAAVLPHLLGPKFGLGAAAQHPPLDQAAGCAEGHPAPPRRCPRRGGRVGRDRRLQSRRAAGRRRGGQRRLPRCLRRRGGRTLPRAVRQRRARRGGRVQGAGAGGHGRAARAAVHLGAGGRGRGRGGGGDRQPRRRLRPDDGAGGGEGRGGDYTRVVGGL